MAYTGLDARSEAPRGVLLREDGEYCWIDVTADRTRLDDKTLEILILLKMNKELYIDMEKMVEEGKVDIDFAAVPDSYFGDFEAV